MLNLIYCASAAVPTVYALDQPFTAFWVSLVIGAIVALILVSQSHTKVKAKKAEKYVKAAPEITEQSDVYTHTSTEKRKVG